MLKDQKGNVVVLVVVVIAVLLILGIGFWAILSSKKQSSQLLKDRETVRPNTSQSSQ